MSDHLHRRYELTGLIGKGSMSSVYRALDTRLNRILALKVMHERMGKYPKTLARFRDEARLLANLKHPNIVSVFDLLEMDGSLAAHFRGF